MQHPRGRRRAVQVSINRLTFGHEGTVWTAAVVTERRAVLDGDGLVRKVMYTDWLYFWADDATRRSPWFPDDWWTARGEQLIELLRDATPCGRLPL